MYIRDRRVAQSPWHYFVVCTTFNKYIRTYGNLENIWIMYNPTAWPYMLESAVLNLSSDPLRWVYRIHYIKCWCPYCRVRYQGTGLGTDIYILDSGIYLAHQEFQGRAGWKFTGPDLEETEPRGDNHGHGTHVAGIAGGWLCGIAKGTNLWDVKVLNEHAGGAWSGIIAGVNYVTDE